MLSLNATPLMCTPDNSTILYNVRSGDTLIHIIMDQYGVSALKAEEMLPDVMAENSFLQSPNLIYPGQSLSLRSLSPDGHANSYNPSGLYKVRDEWNAMPRQQQLELASLAPLLNIPKNGLDVLKNTLVRNRGLLTDVVDSYSSYQINDISKGQYSYARKKSLETFSRNVGPLEKILFQGKTAKEAMRMKPGGGKSATQPFINQLGKLKTMQTAAKAGGIVLTAASLAITCNQIGQAKSDVEKDALAVEAIAASAAGAATGLAIGILLGTGPVGWTVLVVATLATAAVAYGAGQGAKKLYSDNFSNVRVVETLKIDQFCH